MNQAVISSFVFALSSALFVTQATIFTQRRGDRKLIKKNAGVSKSRSMNGSSPRRTISRLLRPIQENRRRLRDEQISAQLAPALSLITGHLRIGRTFNAAVAEVSDLVAEPLRSILIGAVEESRLGTSLDSVLQRAAAIEGNRHLSVVASVIGLQARHGGSLVEILEAVCETIEEEDRLRRDAKTLTADNRISARVLLALPPAMLLIVSLLNPGYAAPLINDPLGRRMSIVGITLAFIGWRWLRRLGNPDVVA